MKKTILSFIAVIAILLQSCEKEIHITNPKIITTPSVTYMLDTLQHEIIADAEVNGEIIDIEKFEWLITDDKGDTIEIVYQKDNLIKWLPLAPGTYKVEVKLIVENKSFREIEIINVEYKGINIGKFLMGTWVTTGKIGDNTEWKSTFNIVDKGIFSAKINEVVKGSVKSSLGMVGNDDIPSGNINYFGQYGVLGSNHYNGRIRYYVGEISNPQVAEGEINSLIFFNDFTEVEMELILTDYYNSEPPFTKYNVHYKMIKN